MVMLLQSSGFAIAQWVTKLEDAYQQLANPDTAALKAMCIVPRSPSPTLAENNRSNAYIKTESEDFRRIEQVCWVSTSSNEFGFTLT